MKNLFLVMVGFSCLTACGPEPKSQLEQQQDELLAKLEAQQRSAANSEQVATVINLSGNLCARVTNVSQLSVGGGQVYEVTCVEYRGGTGTVRYAIDMRNSSVEKLGG